MKRYITLSLIGIFLLAGCTKDQSVETSPAASSSETEQSQTSTIPSSSGPSAVEVQTSLFQKAVLSRDPKQCEQIENKNDRENCVSAIQTLQKNSEGTMVPETR